LLTRFRDWTKHHPVIDLVVTIVMAIVIAYCVQAWIVKPYRIPSESMTDTLLVSDRIIAARFLYHFKDPSRGDIIVFQPNGRGGDAFRTDEVADTVFVKRLIGMPGEIIGANDGKIYICDGGVAPDVTQPIEQTQGCGYLDEPYVSSTQDDFGPETIPDDRYFMMGDNRADSDDSRNWGPIKRSQIIGRAFMTYWPLNRISFY
jgi:signal peptidase I